MNATLQEQFGDIRRSLTDPLYKNSFFIMLTSIMGAGFGFVFWMCAARLYPPEDVGVATAIISSMGLLILLSRLGLDQAVIRFFPTRDKSRVLGTAVTVTTAGVILVGLFFLLTVETFSPDLGVILPIAPVYMLFLVAYSVTWILEGSFNAIRRSEYYFLLNLLFGSRVLFLFPLVFLGSLGIFSSLGLAYFLGLFVALFLLSRSGVAIGKVDREFLRESLNFSAGNYIAGLLMAAPALILPVVVLNALGPEETAHYFIAYSIALILFMIPQSFSTSLYVEGSHGEALKSNVIRSLVGIYALLIPAIIVLFLFGDRILGLIGPDYVVAFPLLRVFALSSIFVSIFHTYVSISKVRKDVRALIFISGFIFLMVLGLGYPFMLAFGLIGMGYAWLVTYLLATAAAVVLVARLVRNGARPAP
jgi:O-antigen/teichoic acid export membrane protein